MSRLRWPDSMNSVSDVPGTIQTVVVHDFDGERDPATGERPGGYVSPRRSAYRSCRSAIRGRV